MSILKRISNKYKKDGIFSLLYSVIYWFIKIYLFDKVPAYLSWPFRKVFGGTFEFNNKIYNFFSHPYNKTWANERMVELPIIYNLVRNVENEKTLEVGNVLSHYFDTKHKVIDLYEKGKNIINQDAASISGFDNQFDLIVSISTIEHIGWDCGEKEDGDKIKRAIESIKKCLTNSGVFIFTVPIGYNKYLDTFIHDDYFGNNIHFLKRIERKKWVQVEKEEAITSRYNKPFNAANTIAIIKLKKI